MKDEKEYLGDGAYVTFDGYHLLMRVLCFLN